MKHQILYFSHPICGVCQALRPKVQALLSKKYPSISFREVRIDEEKALAAQYFAFIAPVLILLTNQKEVARLAGVMSVYQIDLLLKKATLQK